MDGLQPYAAGPPRPAGPHAFTPIPTLTKSPADYLRALKRRVWLVLAIGIPLSVLGAIWTVRQPSIYRASAQILIQPPQFDPVLTTLVSHEVGRNGGDSHDKYVPNRIAKLRNVELAQGVVDDPSLAQTVSAGPEAAEELVAALQTRQLPGTDQFNVTLEGTDPARISRQLMLLLESFKKQAVDESNEKIDHSKEYAQTSLSQLQQDLFAHKKKLYEMLQNSATIGPDGKNLKATQFEMFGSLLMHKQSRLGELQQQAWLSQAFPSFRNPSPDVASRDGKLAELERLREDLTGRMEQYRRTIRYFDTDPSVVYTAKKLDLVLDRLTRLRSVAVDAPAADPYDALLDSMKAEIRADEANAKALLVELQESMQEHQKFVDLVDEQKQKVARIATMQTKLSEFDIVSRSQRPPVIIPNSVPEPAVPVRPKRALNLALAVVLSFGLGIGLVCLLEHVDHSVKVPEHLTMGLTLPLFGVVPRMRRTALLHRGGHLWTPGAPDSIEADAYRNVRASLVGATDRRGRIVTLLVTSAKAGEGKSTTALNLAATCARAGERTLLMDVDLRRPSLAGVFHDGDDGHNLGLVDVLRGDLPWQRTVIRSDIPNLDFLPTGDTADIPIEILGTLELRQLVLALSHHYDRVILDGPAILGLADCRMLGRIVDAALLVVRSGSQELRPLQRAKAMLELSQVVIAGVVFNGLSEDLENWSSYAAETPFVAPESNGSTGRRPSAGGLNAPSDEHAALPLAGSIKD